MSESYTPCRHTWWPSIAAGLSGEWSREAAMMDLRWHADEARVFGRAFPSRSVLVARWGWTDKRVRGLLASPEWVDPFNPTTVADLRGEPKGQTRAKQGPDEGQTRANGERLEADTSDERAKQGPSKGQARASEGPHARDLHQHQPPTPGTLEFSAPVPGAAPSPEHSTASDDPPPPSDEDYYASETSEGAALSPDVVPDAAHRSGGYDPRSGVGGGRSQGQPGVVGSAASEAGKAPSPAVGRVAAPCSSAPVRDAVLTTQQAPLGFALNPPAVASESATQATHLLDNITGKSTEVATPTPPSPYHRAIEVFNEEHLSIIGTAYPWQFKGRDADGARVKSWLGTARVTVEDPDAGLMRLRGAVRAYLLAVEARTAWPIGEPAQTRHFTRDLPKWLQVDPSAAPQRPGNESKQSAALRALGKIDLSRFKKPPMEAP